MESTAERAESRNRAQGQCQTAYQLFTNHCMHNGMPSSPEECKRIIDLCLMNAQIVDEFLFEHVKPWL